MVGVKDKSVRRKPRRPKALRGTRVFTIKEKGRIIARIITSDRETFRILSKK